MDAKRRDPKVRSDEATRLRAQLEELAGNLFWSWFSKGTGVDGATIFRALDPARWEATNHDPHALLDGMDDDALADAVARTGLERAIDEAVRALHAYLDAEDSWAEGRAGTLHREHGPGFVVLDFAARKVELYDLPAPPRHGGNAPRLAEVVPLPEPLPLR